MIKSKLIKKTSKAITLLIVLSVIAALAVTSELLYESSGASSFKLYKTPDGLQYYTKSSQDYEIHRSYAEQKAGEVLFLISSQKNQQIYLNTEGQSGSISWNVRKGPKLENILWSRAESATELNVHNSQSVLVSGLGGCCAELTGYRLFDLETGRILMSFNDFSYKSNVTQPFSLEVPNSPLKARYIGALSQDSTRDRDFVEPQTGKSAVLLIKYATDTLKQKIQIDMEVDDGYAASVLDMKLEKDPKTPNSDKIEIQDDHITLWNIDGVTSPTQITGVILKVILNGGNGDKTIKIPVKNDQFDLSSAEVPLGVAIQSIEIKPLTH
ncbi:MAG: hypothetical protein ACXVCY_00615 [Pseudobdellovibrionaceae bacterium]